MCFGDRERIDAQIRCVDLQLERQHDLSDQLAIAKTDPGDARGRTSVNHSIRIVTHALELRSPRSARSFAARAFLGKLEACLPETCKEDAAYRRCDADECQRHSEHADWQRG